MDCWNCPSVVPAGAATCPGCGFRARGAASVAPAASAPVPESAAPESALPVTPPAPGGLLFPPRAAASTAPAAAPSPEPQQAAAPTRPPADEPAAGATPLFAAGQADGSGPLFAPARPVSPAAPAEAPDAGGTATRPTRRLDLAATPAPTAAGSGSPPPGASPPPLGSPSAGRTPPPGPTPPPVGGPGQAPLPPPGPGAAAAPSPSGATPSGRVVGKVEGDISLDTDERSLRGVQVLVVAFLCLIVVGLVSSVGAFMSSGMQMVGLLIPAAVVILVPMLIGGRAFGIAPSRMLGGVSRTARGAVQGGARMAGRGAVTGARGGARMSRSAGMLSTVVSVRRFRIRAMTGELVPCVQVGELVSDEIRNGDVVLVEGRRNRDGQLEVAHVELLQTPSGPTLSIVRTRGGTRHRVSLVADKVCLVAGLLLAIYVLVQVVRLVS
jgi:hypothetical protein